MGDKSNKNSVVGITDVVGFLIAIIVAVLGFVGIPSWIESVVEEKLDDPERVSLLASKIRPELFLNYQGSVTLDRGALDYIEDIEIEWTEEEGEEQKEISKLIITPKEYMGNAPLVTSTNGSVYDLRTERGSFKEWIIIFEKSYQVGTQQEDVLRIEILDR